MAKYALIALAILLVIASAFGLYERSSAKGFEADAKASAQALTQAQSDLLIARAAAGADSKITVELDAKIQVRFDTNVAIITQQQQLERTDPDVKAYLATPVPTSLGELLDREDCLSGSSGSACGKPASAGSGAQTGAK